MNIKHKIEKYSNKLQNGGNNSQKKKYQKKLNYYSGGGAEDLQKLTDELDEEQKKIKDELEEEHKKIKDIFDRIRKITAGVPNEEVLDALSKLSTTIETIKGHIQEFNTQNIALNKQYSTDFSTDTEQLTNASDFLEKLLGPSKQEDISTPPLTGGGYNEDLQKPKESPFGQIPPPKESHIGSLLPFRKPNPPMAQIPPMKADVEKPKESPFGSLLPFRK